MFDNGSPVLVTTAKFVVIWAEISSDVKLGRLTPAQAVEKMNSKMGPIAVVVTMAHEAGVIDLNNLNSL